MYILSKKTDAKRARESLVAHGNPEAIAVVDTVVVDLVDAQSGRTYSVIFGVNDIPMLDDILFALKKFHYKKREKKSDK